MKNQIIELRSQGKTYKEIQEELGCSKSTISYHCGEGQKEKTKRRSIKNYSVKREGQNSKRNWLRSFAWRYKSMIGCNDCGIKDPRVLDYDHINREEKLWTISELSKWSHSMKVLKEEIRKCEVRCSNCHRIRTFDEKHTSK